MNAHAPIQIYTNNYKIVELAEPMSPDPFLMCTVGSGNKTKAWLEKSGLATDCVNFTLLIG